MKHKKGPKKRLMQNREGLEIQRKALRRGKNLAFSEDTSSGKE